MPSRLSPRARPLSLAAIALVAGLVAGLHERPALLPLAAGTALGAAVAAFMSGDRRWLTVAALAGVAVGGMVLGQRAVADGRRDCRAGWESGAEVLITGLALSYLPEDERGSVRLRPGGLAGEGRCSWTTPLRVFAEGPVIPGGRYLLRGSWRPGRLALIGPQPPERWGWVVARELELIRPASIHHPFLTTRGRLAQGLWGAYPRRWAPLAQALVLGQRETLSADFYQRVARAGLAHLLAISGLHVGLLALGVYGSARVLRVPRRLAGLLTILLVSSYVGMIGAPASAVRAALMITLWTLTRFAGRASSAFDVLGLSAILLLLARPWSVIDPGFQLSFAGAAAVGYAHAEARRLLPLSGWPRAVQGVFTAALASTAAVLLTAPITATHFGRVAPAAIFGNLVAVPLLGLTMPALFLSTLLAPAEALASWPSGAAILLLRTLDRLAGALGSLAWASIDVARPALLPTLGYLVLLVMGVHALYGAWERRRFLLAVGLLTALAILWQPLGSRLAPEHLRVFVLDVGQGDAIAISTPRRRWLLVDAGPRVRDFDAGARRVVPFLRQHSVNRLEAWLASHPDLDHVGGGPAVIEAVEVEQVIGPGFITGQSGQIELLRSLSNESGRWVRAAAGSQLSVDGVDLIFLHPEDRGAAAPQSANELSLVFLLRFGRFRMLFTGDVNMRVEDRLGEEYGAEIQAQVLKVAHHGSLTSTSRFFLETVSPQLAVISVGRANRYGHPSPLVVQRLTARQIEVRRTDRDGTVVIEARSDGAWTVRSAAEAF